MMMMMMVMDVVSVQVMMVVAVVVVVMMMMIMSHLQVTVRVDRGGLFVVVVVVVDNVRGAVRELEVLVLQLEGRGLVAGRDRQDGRGAERVEVDPDRARRLGLVRHRVVRGVHVVPSIPARLSVRSGASHSPTAVLERVLARPAGEAPGRPGPTRLIDRSPR